MINELNINSLEVDYFINNKYLKEGSEYIIYDKNNYKPIFSFQPYLTSKQTITFFIRETNHLISRKEAVKLLKKYKINKSIKNLKSEDTIKLVPYCQFREQNLNFVNELRKDEDKIRIITNVKGEKLFNSKDYKINW